MPHIIGAVAYQAALAFVPPIPVAPAKFNFLSILREQREIDALTVPVGAAWIGAAGPDRGN
jgi:hypothetical protein